jgi:hypothetical protein
MSITDFKDLSPFLSVIVAILALTIGPFISGRVARASAIAYVREKWVYAFRDCLVELITEFDVLLEVAPIEGLQADESYAKTIQKLRTLTNRTRLMANANEPLYTELIEAIERAIDLLVVGIKDFTEFYKTNEKIKLLAHKAIQVEWKKVAPY